MSVTTRTGRRVSGDIDTGRIRLYVLDCPSCGVVFGINDDYEARRRVDARHFYCPNGHNMGWDETEEDRQRARAERLERQLANAQEGERSYRASLIATKGALTKARKRADKGVCQHCNRHFANVERHVAHMHPDAVAS